MKPVYQNALRLFFLLLITNAVGAIGATFVTEDAMNWYNTLSLAPLNPPAVVFGIVWTILYIFIALAAFVSWGKTSPRPICLYLAFTLIWPFIFFKFHSVTGGFIVVILMNIFSYLTLKSFFKASRLAFYLMLPVSLWTVFAAYLNGWLFFH